MLYALRSGFVIGKSSQKDFIHILTKSKFAHIVQTFFSSGPKSFEIGNKENEFKRKFSCFLYRNQNLQTDFQRVGDNFSFRIEISRGFQHSTKPKNKI